MNTHLTTNEPSKPNLISLFLVSGGLAAASLGVAGVVLSLGVISLTLPLVPLIVGIALSFLVALVCFIVAGVKGKNRVDASPLEVMKPEEKVFSERIIVPKAIVDLFIGSQYSLETLSTYDLIGTRIRRDQMTAPIMRGSSPDEQRCFIVMKVTCEATEEDRIALTKTWDLEGYRSFSKLEKMVTLYEDEWGIWDQLERFQPLSPHFFNGNITSVDGELMEGQREHYARFQELIREGQSKDINGVTWKLSQVIY